MHISCKGLMQPIGWKNKLLIFMSLRERAHGVQHTVG